MPKISKEQLRKQLQTRQFSPVYVLHGAESFLRDGAASYLSQVAFGDADLRDFNDNSFSLNDPENIKSALAAADQLPMMAARRVVRITDVRVTNTSARDTLKEDFETVLDGYLANPSPSSIVVFVADEFNGVRKMSKLLERYAETVEFAELQGNDLISWIEKEFAKLGVAADTGAIRHLITLAGSSLRKLTNEISKLAAASLPKARITVDLIDDLVPYSADLDNFALTDNLVGGRPRQAFTVLKKILDDGAEPLALLGLLSYNFRRLLMVKEMMADGEDRQSIVRNLRLRYNDQEAFLASARRTSIDHLVNSIKVLAETDLAIKTSAGGPAGARMMLEMLVSELSDGGRSEAAKG
jgi:DNA polymerase III, delta subunit